MKASIKHTTTLSLAVVLAFALSAVAATAAQAKEPVWYVKGAQLGAGAKAAFTSTSGASTLKSFITLKCTKDSDTGEIVGGVPGTNAKVVVTYTGCEVVGAKEVCAVHSEGKANGTIVTNALKSTLVWLKEKGQEAGDLFGPETGTNFVTIEITGEECSALGTYPVTGGVLGELKPVAEEVVTGKVVFPAKAIKEYWTGDEGSRKKVTVAQLKLGANNAEYIESTDEVTLTSKEVFGVFPEGKTL